MAFLRLFCVVLCCSLVNCQLGFFPRRDDRRFSSASPFGFIQNILPDQSRVRNMLSGILNFNPFSNRGETNNRPDYPYQTGAGNGYETNRPNAVRFPVDGPNDGGNFENPYTNNYVTQPGMVAVSENSDGLITGPVADGNGSGGLMSGTVEDSDNGFGLMAGPVVKNENRFGETSNSGGLISGTVGETSNSGGLISGTVGESSNSGGLISGTVGESSNFGGLISGTVGGSSNSGGLISGSVAPEQGQPNSVNFGQSNAFDYRNGGSDARSFDDTCTTIEGGAGSCVVLTSCQVYLQLVSRARTDVRSRMVLQRSHCGFESNVPKVCCPLAGIPTAPPTASIPIAPPPSPTTPTTTTTTTVAPAPSSKTLGAGDYVAAFPDPPVCGVSNGFFGKVVGGVDAKLGDFPWIALLGYQNSRDQSVRWRCGGSLITDRHVLTAGHCIHNHEVDLYVVRLGELDTSKDDDGASPIDVLIKSSLKHELYNSASFENDIGVLYLQQTVAFTNLINPICLPYPAELRSQKFERLTPMIAGWGDVQFRGPSATHLQVVQLPVQTNDLCVKAYAKYPKQVIDERVLCAGYKEGGKDACQGDSGGPLMLPNWNNVTFKTYFYQIGVVSYGKNCAEAGFPGVYSRVTNFIPWLEKVVLGKST